MCTWIYSVSSVQRFTGQREGQAFNTALYLLLNPPAAFKSSRLPCWVCMVQMMAGRSVPLFTCIFCFAQSVHTLQTWNSLGISMQDTGIWSGSSWFLSLILILLRQMLKDFALVISVCAYASGLGTQDNGFPKTRSSQRLLSWRIFFWSSHNANIIAYSTSLKFNFASVWQPGACVSVQAIQMQVELVLERLPPPHTLVSTAYILAVAVCEDGKCTFVRIVPAEE